MDVTKPYKIIWFGAMDVTKPYKFIRCGAMDVIKAYKFIGLGAMDVTKPCKFIGFGAMDVTKPYKLIWFGAMDGRSLIPPECLFEVWPAPGARGPLQGTLGDDLGGPVGYLAGSFGVRF